MVKWNSQFLNHVIHLHNALFNHGAYELLLSNSVSHTCANCVGQFAFKIQHLFYDLLA